MAGDIAEPGLSNRGKLNQAWQSLRSFGRKPESPKITVNLAKGIDSKSEKDLPGSKEVRAFGKILDSLSSEQTQQIMNWGDLGNTAAMLIGVKPSAAVHESWANLIPMLESTDPALAGKFDVIPQPAAPEGTTASMVYLVNKDAYLSKVQEHKGLFPPVKTYAEARAATAASMSTYASTPEGKLKTGVLLGYPAEDVKQFALYAEEENKIVGSHVLDKGQTLLRQGFSQPDVDRFLLFNQFQIGNVPNLSLEEQVKQSEVLKTAVNVTLSSIPGLKPEVRAYSLNRRRVAVKEITWIGSGRSQERDRYVHKVQTQFAQSGMDALLARHGKVL